VVFNIANLLRVAAIDIAGLAVAFPIGIGLALVVGVLLNYFISPQGSPLLLFGGVLLVVLAIIVDALAYRCSTGVTMQPLSVSGRLTIFNTALITRLVVRVCSISSRASHQR